MHILAGKLNSVWRHCADAGPLEPVQIGSKDRLDQASFKVWPAVVVKTQFCHTTGRARVTLLGKPLV